MVNPNPEDDELPVVGPLPLRERGLRVRQAADPLAWGAVGLILGVSLIALGQLMEIKAMLGVGVSSDGAALSGYGIALGLISLAPVVYGLWAMAANTELAAEAAARRLRADDAAQDDATAPSRRAG